MHQATLKVAGGKLLRVKMELDGGDRPVIRTMSLTGDFFLHPESVLPEIEQALCGLGWPEDEAVYAAAVQKILDSHHATFIGVAPLDIAQAIRMAVSAS